MTKFNFFCLQVFVLTMIVVGFGGVATAQTPSSDATAAESAAPATDNVAQAPQEQTLLQESPDKDKDAAKTEEADKSDSSAPPPSLSEYLNNAGLANEAKNASGNTTESAAAPSEQSKEATFDAANPPIPALDMQSLQGGPAKVEAEESPEALKKKADEALRKEAFNAAAGQMMPLRPGEIRRMLELYDETKQASETPIYPSPEPISSFEGVSLDPGAKPLVIKTAIGNVTTVSIVDITGQPWPIQDLTWAGDFQVEEAESGSHMLRITPTSEFAHGNVSMRLVGLNPPVIFTLKAERKTVHVRLDVQIPEIGPKGVLPPVDAPISTKAGDEYMTAVLVGVVKGAGTEQLKVEGIDGRTTAYVQGGTMYVRTPYTMLSPAWLKSVQSGDGTKVYALNFTPVVLLSDKGKMVRAYLSHKEKSDEQY